MFWTWCSAPSKSKKRADEEKNAEIKKLQEKLKQLEITHHKEMRELRNEHRHNLAKKDRERHKSCEVRNATIERMKDKNRVLHTRLIKAEKEVALLEKIKEMISENDLG
jgi:hypothetical protein